jgi:hypothetical protein
MAEGPGVGRISLARSDKTKRVPYDVMPTPHPFPGLMKTYGFWGVLGLFFLVYFVALCIRSPALKDS